MSDFFIKSNPNENNSYWLGLVLAAPLLCSPIHGAANSLTDELIEQQTVNEQLTLEQCQIVAQQLEPGDLVFVEINNTIFRKVAETQNHWSSHVGVAFFDESAQSWYVTESTIPRSVETPLCEYLSKGIDGHIGVRRINGGLNSQESALMQANAKGMLGVLYHTGFKYNSNRLFCSKLVNELYMGTLGVQVGYKQSFRELLQLSNERKVVYFWRAWFLGVIPWRRQTLTPATQYFDPNFHTVYEWSSHSN